MKMSQHFPIQGMTCANCVRHVENALKNFPGISLVQVNLDNHDALIEYDSESVTFEAMATALKEAGYTLDKTKS